MKRTHLFLKKLVLTALAAAAIITATPMTSMAASVSTTRVTVNATTNYTYASRVLTLINNERAKQRLKPLYMDKTLLANATTRASECGVYYSHTRANGKAWNTAITKKYKCAAENIAYGQKTPEEVVKSWMNSSGHRKNILNPKYTSIGIGCVSVGNNIYWTQEFTDGTPVKVTCKNSVKKNINIDVTSNRISFEKKSETVSVNSGRTYNMRLNMKNMCSNSKYDLNTIKGMSYSTSNKRIATIDQNGKIRTVGKGRVTITLRLTGSIRKTFTLIVK